jgi:Pvc16 N-terminal domain
MSNYLAIATVTTALRDILQNAATTAVPGAVVTLMRPERAGNESIEKASINLYLYQTIPNTNWPNMDLPTRTADGRLVHRPQIALDLYYLLSFYGSELEMEPQRLLGSTMIALQTEPVLQADSIQQAIASASYLAQSDLSTQVEQIKFAPLNLNLEELSRLWSIFFQVPYTLSIAYCASSVLIEPGIEVSSTRPVLKRGIHVEPEVRQ